MAPGVRNKIASYEAHNTQLRSSPGRSTSASPQRSPALKTTPHTANKDTGNADSPPTVAASQNRVYRMKKQQESKSHAMGRRKLIQERRIQQQQRAANASATSNPRVENGLSEDPAPLETRNPVVEKPYNNLQAGTRLSNLAQQKMKRTENAKRNKSLSSNVTNASAETAKIGHQQSTKLAKQAQLHFGRVDDRSRMTSTANQAAAESNRTYTSPPRSSAIPYASPGSEVDSPGDTHYPSSPVDPQSVDQMTDDDATLTSVWRIMNRGVNESFVLENQSYAKKSGITNDREEASRVQRHASKDSSYERVRDMDRHPDRATNGKGRTQSRLEPNSEKGHTPTFFRTVSSSDYDTDGDISKNSKASRNSLRGSRSKGPDMNEMFLRSRSRRVAKRLEDDDRTFDYGDRDDGSNGSISFEARGLQRNRSQNGAQTRTSKKSIKERELGPPSSLINKEDVEHYTKSLDSPSTKVGFGVVGAVAVGCMVLGPAGLLAGVAAVGLGVGFMQIPEEEREKLLDKAQKSCGEVQDKAFEVSESLSNTCVNTYEESGVAEHIGPCLALAGDGTVPVNDVEKRKPDGQNGSVLGEDSIIADGNPRGTIEAIPSKEMPVASRPEPPPPAREMPRNKRVACLRNVRILPAGQIYGLDPASQPKAWLDILASANTTEEEKIEAMEEILILAKDKKSARIFLDEGILDSLLWILDRYFEKVSADSFSSGVSYSERMAVELAAACCVTLGKTHCAAIHTEGDLQLMSLYERGTVPEERQVAQMFHEIPHHVRITNTPDPSIIDPSKEVFALRQLDLPQAEELSRSIMSIANNKF